MISGQIFPTVAVLLVALFSGCGKQQTQPIILKREQVSEDFVLTAYMKGKNRIHGNPIKGSSPQAYSGQIEIRSPDAVKIAEGIAFEGLLNGPFISWHSNGMVNSFAYYAGGDIDGVAAHWNEIGRLVRTSTYKNGAKHGVEIYWNTNDVPESKIVWKLGKPVSVTIYEDRNVVTNVTGQDAAAFLLRRLKSVPGR